jgi:hypothetical protein
LTQNHSTRSPLPPDAAIKTFTVDSPGSIHALPAVVCGGGIIARVFAVLKPIFFLTVSATIYK